MSSARKHKIFKSEEDYENFLVRYEENKLLLKHINEALDNLKSGKIVSDDPDKLRKVMHLKEKVENYIDYMIGVIALAKC